MHAEACLIKGNIYNKNRIAILQERDMIKEVFRFAYRLQMRVGEK